MSKLRLEYGKDEARHAGKLMAENPEAAMGYILGAYTHFAYNRVVHLVNNTEFEKEQRRIAKKLTMTLRDANFNFEFNVFKEDGSIDEEEQKAYIFFLAMITRLYEDPKLGINKEYAEELLAWINARYEDEEVEETPELKSVEPTPAIKMPDISKDEKAAAIKKAAEEARN